MGHSRGLSPAACRPCRPSPSGPVRPHLGQRRPLLPISVLGDLVAVRTSEHGSRRPGMVRAFLPRGALTEFASRHGRGRAIPRWIKWSGWPFVAFVSTTIYGQMVSVYQYAGPALVILGGSTLAAILVGLSYGRGKRVWCRYLCPVSGVFGLLAKLAPLHFEVDAAAWHASQQLPKRRFAPINCAPLVPIRTMRGASAVPHVRTLQRLSRRRDSRPALTQPRDRQRCGSCAQPVGDRPYRRRHDGRRRGRVSLVGQPLVHRRKASDRRMAGPSRYPVAARCDGAWWVLTNYPARNDVLTMLDGAILLAYIGLTAIVIGALTCGFLALATRALGRWSWVRFHHLAQSLIPVAGCGIFLGLSALSVTLLRGEGLRLEWVDLARAVASCGGFALVYAAGDCYRGALRPLARAPNALDPLHRRLRSGRQYRLGSPLLGMVSCASQVWNRSAIGVRDSAARLEKRAECVLATAGLTQIRGPHSLYFLVPAAWDYPYAGICTETPHPG